jgi:hypothetical protein
MSYGRRVGLLNISGLFSTPSSEIWDMRGTTYSFEQKFSRGYERHLIKAGFRVMRETGGRLNPQNPGFGYQNYADLLSNTLTSLNISFGAPPHDSKMDQYSLFLQDDWRLGTKLVVNAGLRYDYYGVVKVKPTTPVEVEIVNFAPATDFRKLDFGSQVDPLKPYNPDASNFGPRLGFAWTVDSAEKTVVRGGVGYLYSPHLAATVRESAANPYIPFRIIYNRTESAAKGLKWPYYTDDVVPLALADANGRKSIFSIFNTDLPVPYTIQSMISVQRALTRSMAMDIGYVRTDGNDFPLQRQFTQAIDRQTGTRPNPALGAPGGYYVDSSQTMVYNGLQMTLRRRFANRYSWDVNYTLATSEATQGGDLSAYYIATVDNTQDFWNPEYDRAPANNDVHHRMNGSFIYELPGINGDKGFLNGAIGGWQLSGIIQTRTGTVLRVTQPSGIDRSRPDVVAGADLIVSNWQDTCAATGCTYLNTAAFALVPVSSVTNATLRPGTYQLAMARGPASVDVSMTFAKSFPLGAGRRIQVRADVFNLPNRMNLNNPVVASNNVDFGRITGAANARRFQFGARLSF